MAYGSPTADALSGWKNSVLSIKWAFVKKLWGVTVAKQSFKFWKIFFKLSKRLTKWTLNLSYFLFLSHHSYSQSPPIPHLLLQVCNSLILTSHPFLLFFIFLFLFYCHSWSVHLLSTSLIFFLFLVLFLFSLSLPWLSPPSHPKVSLSFFIIYFLL